MNESPLRDQFYGQVEEAIDEEDINEREYSDNNTVMEIEDFQPKNEDEVIDLENSCPNYDRAFVTPDILKLNVDNQIRIKDRTNQN